MEFIDLANVLVMWGFQFTLVLRNSPQNIVIPIGDCELDGFTYDVFTEYKQPSVKRTAKKGKITATVPATVSGEYYPAVLLYDGSGKEAFRLSIDDEEKGTIVANRDDNRTYVFALKEPVYFQGGEKVTLETLTSEGTYRTEDVILLKEKPTSYKQKYEITHLDTRTRDDNSVKITFITNWDVTAKVEYGLTQDYGEVVSEKEPFNNHRIAIEKLKPNKLYHYRIVAETDEGEKILTPDATFLTQPKELPKGKAELQKITITTTHSLSDSQFVPPGVTSGIPFPEADIADSENIRLLCDDREILLQVKVLSRYPDGSIRWALLDFQLQGDKTEYTLEYGSKIQRTVSKPENPVYINEDENKVTVDTGVLQMTIDKKHGIIFDEVLMNGELVTSKDKSMGLSLIDCNGKKYRTLEPPEEIKVLENGPMRGVIMIRGRHYSEDEKSLFNYEFELHFYAGWSGIKVFHTWGNDNTSENFTSIKSLSLQIPAIAGESLIVSGEPGSTCETSDIKKSLRLEQYYDDEFEIKKDGQILSSGKHACGWISSGKVAVLVRNFWQLYPKVLTVDSNGIEIGIMPPIESDQYLDREEPEYRLYYYLENGLYKLKQGVTKRHEFWILPSEEIYHKDSNLGKLSQGIFEGSALAFASPEWYVKTGVMGRFVPEVKNKVTDKTLEFVKTYDEAVKNGFQIYLTNRDKNHEYGMLNFGDWWGERHINWGNIEYDTQHALFLQFLRSSDFRYFLAGEQAERHNMDVDTVWYGSRKGLVYAHCIGHTGDYYTKSPVEGHGSPRGGFSISHSWVEGHLDYYFLTGNRRAFSAAKMIADHYDSYGTRNYDFNNCRTPGWHLILTMAMYYATDDPSI